MGIIDIIMASYGNFLKEIIPALNLSLIFGAIYATILIDLRERFPFNKYSKHLSDYISKIGAYLVYLMALMFLALIIILAFTLLLWLFFCLVNLRFI